MQDACVESGRLVLSRKVNESVTILSSDGPVVVTLEQIRPGAARLLFVAPKSVPILRSEVVERAFQEAKCKSAERPSRTKGFLS